MSRSQNLPVLPQVVAQILKCLDDPNSSPRALECILERDPSISAKVLRIANSAAYSSGEVTSVSRALSLLGMRTLRSLVVSVGYQQLTSGGQTSKLFSKSEFWSHSLAVGTAARILAKIKKPELAEELYTAGVMHDIGLLVLDRFLPDALDQAITSARDQCQPLSKSLREILGFSQAEVGGILAESWELPEGIRAAIRYHLNPFEDADHCEASSIVGAADVLGHQCGYENHVPGYQAELDPIMQSTLELPEEQLEVIRMVVKQEVERVQASFQVKRAA